MSNYTFKSWIEIPIEVEFEFTKGMKGTRDRYGVPEEPDDDDEIEIVAVRVVSSVKDSFVEINELLTKKQMDSIEQDAWDNLKERDE